MSAQSTGRRRFVAALPTILYRAATAALLGGLGVLLVWRPVYGCSDLWSHAAVGSWLWETASMPVGALHLWAASAPGVSPSWLSPVVRYGPTQIGPEDRFGDIVLGFTALLSLLPFAV